MDYGKLIIFFIIGTVIVGCAIWTILTEKKGNYEEPSEKEKMFKAIRILVTLIIIIIIGKLAFNLGLIALIVGLFGYEL